MGFLQRLISELKRRRVFRVAGVYAIVAWAVIQVADTVFPAMQLPDWTLRLVIALAALGFPVVVALAWVFDITPEGVRRGVPRLDPAGALQPAAAAPRMLRRSMWFALGILVAGSGAWIAVHRDEAAALDPNMVAVLPFRVNGGQDLEYLREGMLDLLAATLTGDGGPRSSDPRSLLAAWKRAVPSAGDDLPQDAAIDFARGIGAGQVLLGGIVGTRSQFTVTAKVLAVPGAEVRAQASEAGSESELTQVVERLSAKLLTQLAGDQDVERVNSLAGAPLPVLREYLAGRNAYRLGHYTEAATHYEAVLALDSSFALAALELTDVYGWTDGENSPKVRESGRVAFEARARLSPRDMKMLLAKLGPNYPETSTDTEIFEAAQEMVAAAPDRPEAWYRLGDFVYHNYADEDPDNFRETARRALNRAVELDSTFVGAMIHLVEFASTDLDREEVARIAAAALNADSAGEVADYMRWHAARASGSRDDRAAARAKFPELGAAARWISSTLQQQVWDTLDIHDIALLRQITLNRAVTREERVNVLRGEASFQTMLGRPAAAEAILKQIRDTAFVFHSYAVTQTIAHGIPAVHLPDARRALEAIIAQPIPTDEDAVNTYYAALMAVESLKLLEGDTSSARKTIATARAIDRQRTLPPQIPDWPGPLMLEAMMAVETRASDAPAKVQRFAHVIEEIRLRGFWVMLAARMLDRIGDTEGALRQLDGAPFPSAALERARLNVKLGNREMAVREYQNYLIWLYNPEPSVQPQVDRARAELAALVGE